MLRAAGHLLSVLPLRVLPDGSADLYVTAKARAFRRTRYQVDKRPALFIDLPNAGEYVQVEVYDGFFSIGWSTAMTLPHLLRLINQRAPSPPEKAIVYSTDRGREEITDGPAGMRALNAAPQDYHYVRLEFPQFTITWAPSQITARRVKKLHYGDFGWMSTTFDKEEIAALMRETATSAVGIQAPKLCTQVEFIGDYVPQGSVLNP